MAPRADIAPWVIVAGGFHHQGGMDRANAALAAHLRDSGVRVHLVGHEIDAALSGHPGVRWHAVPRPKGMPATAERLLARAGVRVAREVVGAASDARVVVNGGNCPWPDINWVHALHAAWPVRDAGAPWWGRYRNRRLKTIARHRERMALERASIIVANSEATRRAIVDRIGVPPARVRTVYLGSDPTWGPAGAAERAAARAAFSIGPDVPVVVFVGALGTDTNKGFDILWDAWRRLSAAGDWDAQLIVAGGGWRVDRWRDEAMQSGLTSSVRFLGFTSCVRDILAAGDLLVSPVHYEAYGLNVHEALCRGLSVMVTRSAGVVERFDPAMSNAVLPENITAAALSERLRAWRNDMPGWRSRALSTSARVRARSWSDMAADFVAVVQKTRELIPA